MAKPWERYQGQAGLGRPWERYSTSASREPEAEKPKSRSAFAVANDTVIELANAAVGGLGAAADFAVPGNRFSRATDEFVKSGQSKQSDITKADRAKFQKALDQSEGIGDDLSAVGDYLTDSPLQAAAQAAGSFALPGGAIKGARALAGAAGAGARGTAAAGTAAGMATGAAMGGGDAAGSAYDLVMEIPEATLLASDQAKTLAAQGYLPSEIRETLAQAAGRDASILPALAGAAAGAFGAERVLAGGRLAQGGVRGALGTGAVEAVTEGAEEGLTQYEGRRAAQQIDPSIDPTKNVAAMAAMGAAQGGALGAGVGAMSRGRRAGDSIQDRYAEEAERRAAQEATEPAAPPAAPPALPAPVVTVDQSGEAQTADQRMESETLAQLEQWAREELGYTPDVEQAGARHPGRADSNPQSAAVSPASPLALPAPIVTIDGEGTARTADQRMKSEDDRSELGLTEDVERAARRHPGGQDYWREGDSFVSTDGRGDRVSWPAEDATAVDRAAGEAQTAPGAQLPEPSEAQKQAGNYKKGHARISGLEISIENPAGSERRGTDPDGRPWANTMAGHYGYVRRTEGADGDQVDVFIKPGTGQEHDGQVFVIDQVDPKTGKFDEHKVMVGYASQAEAEQAYRASYDADWQGLGQVTPMAMGDFKDWLRQGETKRPVGRDLSRQNRDRSRPASIEQMNRIANSPDYDRLGFGRSPNEAAPMVSVAGNAGAIPDADMGRSDRVTLGDGSKVPVRYAVVEAGDVLASHAVDGSENTAYFQAPAQGQIRALNNGRAAGLQAAHQRGRAAEYVQAMIEDTPAHGVSPEAIRAKRQPVLVRVYDDAENRRPNIGALSNPQSNLGMSATEQAANDARHVPVDLLNLGETGVFDGPSNRRFLDAFARGLQQQGEDAAQITDAQGRYSKQLMDRARAAVFHRAYADDALTAMAAESADPDVRNILNALTMAAPDFAGVEAGPLDIRPQLARSVHEIRDARARGLTLEQHLAQQDMFGRDQRVDRLAGMLWGNIRAPRRISDSLREMALFVQNEQARSSTGDMFGGPGATVENVIERGESLIRNRDGSQQATGQSALSLERPQGDGRADPDRSGRRKPAGRGRAASDDAEDSSARRPQQREVASESRQEPRSSTGVSSSGARKISLPDAVLAASSFMKALPGARKLQVRVVRKVADIQEGSRPSPLAEGVYYPANDGGKIYLVLENLPTKERLQQVLAHEVTGHFGMEALLGDGFPAVLAEVRRISRAPRDIKVTGNEKPGDPHYATMEAVAHRYPDYSARARAREVLARMAEENQKRTFLATVYAQLRKALRAMGLNLQITNADLRQMIVDAGRFLQTAPAERVQSRMRMAAASMAASEGKPVEWTEADIAAATVKRPAKTFDGARAAAKLFMGKPLVNRGSGLSATVSRNNLDKMLSAKAVNKSVSPAAQSSAVANLDQLFDRAVLGWSKQDRMGEPTLAAIHRFFAPMTTDSGSYMVKMTVKETQAADRANPLYTVETIEFSPEKSAVDWLENAIVEDFGRGAPFGDQLLNALSGSEIKPDSSSPRGLPGAATWVSARGESPSGSIRSAQDVISLARAIEAFNDGRGGQAPLESRGAADATPPRQSAGDEAETPTASTRPGATTRRGESLHRTEQLLRDRALGKIGAFSKRDTIEQRLAKLSEGWKAKAVQGVFDQFMPLRALSNTAYMQARLSKGTDGAAEYLVRHGPVKLEEGAIDGAEGKGLAEILASLNGEHDFFMAWIAGNRAERLRAEGRENLFTAEDIETLKRLGLGRMPDGRKRTDVYPAALRDLNALQKSVLDLAQDAGLIDGASRKLWENEFYVPFYRVMEDDSSGTMGPGQIGGLVGQRAFKKLKGGQERLGDLTANTVSNWSHLLSASMKNLAAQGALKSAVEMGIAEQIGSAEKGSVRVMDGGKERHYLVDDPMVLDALTSLHYVGSNDPFMKAMRKFKHALTIGVTISPTFRVRNMLRDTLQAVSIDSDIKLNPVANMIQGWKSTASDSPTMQKLLAGGGAVRFGSFNDGQARNVKRLVDELGVDPDQVVMSPAGVSRFARKFFDWYQETGDRAETINRAAIYEAARAKGKSHLEASYAARDLMDFTAGGTFAAVRILSQVVPFMNARLQGMYKLGRGAGENPARFGAVAGVVGLASALLYLTMKDDEDYKALPDWARNTYWVAKVPGTDKMIYIPKPFEIGALGTVVERATELAFGGDDYRAGDFAKTVAGVMGDQLAMNPVPQAVKPAMEAAFNYDTFRGRNIDSMGQERLPAGDRFTAQTSAGAVALGRAAGISPQRIEHLVRGYFGWLGTQALNVGDYLARPLSNLPDNPRRDLSRIDNWFVVGDFLKDADARSSKYIQRFYDQQREVDQVYAAYNQARALGDVARAEELARSDEAQLHGIYRAAGRDMTKINQQIKRLENSSLPADEKRARLNEMYQARNRLAGLADARAREVQ